MLTLVIGAYPVFAKDLPNGPEIHHSQTFIQSSYVPYLPPTSPKIAIRRTETRNWDYLLLKYTWPIFEARKIMACESGGNPDAIGDRSTAYKSYGLFQIRALPGRPSPEWLLNPENNVSYAYSLYKKSGWLPWLNCSRTL